MLSLRTVGIEWSLGNRPYWELDKDDDDESNDEESELKSVADRWGMSKFWDSLFLTSLKPSRIAVIETVWVRIIFLIFLRFSNYRCLYSKGKMVNFNLPKVLQQVPRWQASASRAPSTYHPQ